MKRFLSLGIVAILVACGGATGGGSSTAGNSSSGAGPASIDLTISGALQAKSTQLAHYNCSGAQFGAFSDTFNPVINGSQYVLELLIGDVKTTPLTRDLASQENHILLDIHNDQQGWARDSQTTGTITIDPGADSGTVDAHSLEAGVGVYQTKVDLKFTFTCPTKQ
jgi:hypothetical protein